MSVSWDSKREKDFAQIVKNQMFLGAPFTDYYCAKGLDLYAIICWIVLAIAGGACVVHYLS